MSRGGTRKARAEQEARHRRRRRKVAVEARSGDKNRRKKRIKKPGRGRAALLHLSGFAAPLILAFGLIRSGVASEDTARYWLGDLVSEPNASFFAEPIGFLYALIVVALAAAVFALSPVALWRRLYRGRNVLDRDRTSVDSAFTLLVITGIIWLFRIIFGYNDSVGGFAVIMSILAVYVPIFSALLAIGMPVVPGSGRIGGILPTFLRINFTERFLLSDSEREVLRLFDEDRDAGGDRPSDDSSESHDPEGD